ncbi:MAG: pyruvate ferredoxin oxidoreductase [Thermoplasmata archaeon]|nr:MAG: pyruvate ferredoxin oxidoreductase [Thermoplasmata archaeon]
MVRRDVIHGSRALAEAVKLCDVNVIAAYPITPQTHIVEDIARFIANGELNAEYIRVESEHSAMSACIGASAAGARTFTATSSQGLALMYEMLFVASGLRLPIVMANANRAMSSPINIWNDQQDSISIRDCGWLQFYCETNQEVLDLTIQAYKISESEGVHLPSIVCLDGYVLTHTIEPVEIPEKEDVRSFLPPYSPPFILDPATPMTLGPLGDPSVYMEFRIAQQKAMEKAYETIRKVNREFEKKFGRKYGLIEKYNMEDAEIAIVTLGSVAGTIKEFIDSTNEKIGLVKIWCYRPFPREELIQTLRDVNTVAVVEKDVSIGLGEGAVFSELKGIFYSEDVRPKIIGAIVGLGGRDVANQHISRIIEECKNPKHEVIWVG